MEVFCGNYENISFDKVNFDSKVSILKFVKQPFIAATNGLGAVDSYMTPAVLLIDDNAVQAATRQTILRRGGYSAIAVLSPRTGTGTVAGMGLSDADRPDHYGPYYA